jgi:hypothetical protein
MAADVPPVAMVRTAYLRKRARPEKSAAKSYLAAAQ